MIFVIKGNLFNEVPVSGSVEPIIIAHGCNAQGKMRSGFAKVVRDLNEGVFNAYIQSGHQLGSVSYFELYPNVFVANCVTQEFYGYDGIKYTSYDAVDSCFKKLNDFIKELLPITGAKRAQLMFPKIGAVLGGGNLEVINKIIDVNVQDELASKVQFVI